MFKNLSLANDAFMNWEWSDYEPYANDLLGRDVTEDTLDDWLTDWSQLSRIWGETFARLNLATTQDTTDQAALERKMQFVKTIYPKMQVLTFELDKKLVESGLQPSNFEIPMRSIRARIEHFCEENLPLEAKEVELVNRYNEIAGAQSVTWEGKERTLQQLMPLYQDRDRAKREQVWWLETERRLEDREAFDNLWSDFLELRKQMYQNAGDQDFREYIWKERGRFDYTPENAIEFCESIEQVVVPAAERVYEKRRQQLGLESLRPWDLQVDPTENDVLEPFNSEDDLKHKTGEVFNRVDAEIGEYFQIMRDENLLDLFNRKGKGPGGYCTYFPVVRRPFIFMNAVGIQGDVKTLLHEGGHAFHGFIADQNTRYIHERRAPMEFNEVASMAMELLASPYLTHDYGGYYTDEEAARARIQHAEKILKFWPYMAVVVLFQHWAYTHHDEARDAAKCDAKWTELYLRFTKGVDFTGLEDWVATGWHRKHHIFKFPFYYIEYGLAQLGAVQVWANALNDQEQAVQDYKAALALGGTVTLPELYARAGAKFAFDAETLQSAVDLLENTIQELEATM